MSYNTRRGAFRGGNHPPRRPQQHNFQHMPQQSNLRQQAEKFLQAQKVNQQPNPSIIKQESTDQKPGSASKVEMPPPPPVISEQPVKTTNGDDVSIPPLISTNAPPKEKPAWVKGSGKINKRELRRRRNLRLRKMLQPKNALMVLNELVGSTVYDVIEAPDLFSGAIFKCNVRVDGIDHIGLGKSKPAAKNAAAETALKYLVLSKVNKSQCMDSAGLNPEGSENEIKMEVEENSEEISWSHVACYALHKLLSSWDEGATLNLAEKVSQVTNNGGNDSTDSGKDRIIEKRPAKKLPENASEMNPLMLLNQMVPNAIYEEVSKEGNPPHVTFTIKCTIGNDVFLGTASTKKGARKACAFAACRQILGIQYTSTFLQEHSFSEEAVRIVSGSSMQAA